MNANEHEHVTAPIPSQIEEAIGGLHLCAAHPLAEETVHRSFRLWRHLVALGASAPLWLVTDLVSAFSEEAPHDPVPRETLDFVEGRAREQWARDRLRLRDTPLFTSRDRWMRHDDLVTAVMFHLLEAVRSHWLPGRQRRPSSGTLEGAAGRVPVEALLPRVGELYHQSPRHEDLRVLRALGQGGAHLLIAATLIDASTLHAFGVFDAKQQPLDPLHLADLLEALGTADAAEIARFSLDLLPTALSMGKASGRQLLVGDGYDGVEPRGSFDGLLMSELALDDALFVHRYLEGTLLRRTFRKQQEAASPLRIILVDASASMRGPRSVFARGLALAMLKRASLAKEDAVLRFFDARLHPPLRFPSRSPVSEGRMAPRIVAFRGERGRNYGKVFAELAYDLAQQARQHRRRPSVHMLTHAQCHVPIETIRRIRENASLYGVFMLPSTANQDLAYLDELDGTHWVTEASLKSASGRVRSGKEVLLATTGSTVATSK